MQHSDPQYLYREMSKVAKFPFPRNGKFNTALPANLTQFLPANLSQFYRRI